MGKALEFPYYYLTSSLLAAFSVLLGAGLFPGPKLAAATKWYEFYFDILKWPGGQFIWEINRMHDVYGPIVRINPDELHVKDPEWYDVPNGGGNIIRDKFPQSAALVGTPLGVFGTIKHDVHRIRKAPPAAYFSRRSVREAQPLMRAEVEKLCQRLRQKQGTGEPVDVRPALLAFATDIPCQFGFGGSMRLSESPTKAVQWMDTMNAVAVVTPFFKQYPNVLPWLFKLSRSVVKMVWPTVLPMLNLHRVRLTRIVHEQRADNRRKCGEQPVLPSRKPPLKVTRSRTTSLHAILNSNLPQEEKSLDRLAAQDAFLAITAEGDPPARTMAIGTYYLLTNKAILKQLHAELDHDMPDPWQLPDLHELESLPYLKAVIKETMRVTGSPFPDKSYNAIFLGCTKTSICIALTRIFEVIEYFRFLAGGALALPIGWALQTILIAFLICTPLSYNWDQSGEGHCGDLKAAYLSVGIVDVITDCFIFFLPIPIIHRVNMSLRDKLASTSIFTLGLFTIAAGASRMASVIQVSFSPDDISGAIEIWAVLEPCIAIVVACGLTLRPLLAEWGLSIGNLSRRGPFRYLVGDSGNSGSDNKHNKFKSPKSSKSSRPPRKDPDSLGTFYRLDDDGGEVALHDLGQDHTKGLGIQATLNPDVDGFRVHESDTTQNQRGSNHGLRPWDPDLSPSVSTAVTTHGEQIV
ncbi:hypothetical protein VTN77DRAFT_1429 [Rasamsonia byssochlamydoides]|uniref:uncharacterized protein n=1 Tax=Rasamsonia byssochlamydoides TaxID=89139 RepID=UPI0037431061